MKSSVKFSLAALAGLALALIIGPAEAIDRDGNSHRVLQKTAVTGYFDWTLVPPNLGLCLTNRNLLLLRGKEFLPKGYK